MRSSILPTFLSTVLLLLITITIFSNPAQAHQPSLPLPYRTVTQFSNPTYLQDLYVRTNGDILLTTVAPNGSVWLVTNVTSKSPKVSLLHTFANLTGVTGILETQPGIINFLAGAQTVVGVGIVGTFGVWELDLRNSTGPPSVREIVRIPKAGILAGMIAVPNEPTSVLIADTFGGLVWRVDTLTGKLEVGSQDPNMYMPTWAATPFGVDGIGIHDGYLYWTNGYIASIYRIEISDDGYTPAGSKSELVRAVRSVFLDNFTFGPGKKDTMWVATNADNRLMAITPGGNSTYVLGTPDEMTLAGCTATAFGKLKGDTDTLYVTTDGAFTFPINGTITEGGKLLAVDTRGYVN